MKKRNDQHTPYLFVGGMVAIVAIVALVLNGSMGAEGAATFGKKQADAFEDICVDDDPLNDFSRAGTVNLGPYSYEDYCQDDMLTQYYCKTGKNLEATRPFKCPNGCLNGICRK